MKRILILLWWECLFSTFLFAQDTRPDLNIRDKTPQVHAFENCTIITKPGKKIKNGVLIIRDKKVEYAGSKKALPQDALVHNLKGAWIYPGFIDPWSDLGLDPPKAGAAPFRGPPQYESKKQGPYAWNQAIKAEIKVAELIKANKEKSESLRALGYTTVNIVPNDGIFRGSSALLALNDEPIHESLIETEATACLSFEKGSSTQSYPSSLMGSIALIRQTLLDAQWYKKAVISGQNEKVEKNLSIEALNVQLASGKPLLFKSNDVLSTIRAEKIAKEFGLKFTYKTDGDEYKRIEAIKELGAGAIISINFPEAYEIDKIADAREISLRELRAWEQAPMNPASLAKEKISFSITPSGLKKLKKDFYKNLRKAIAHGLSKVDALAALTLAPAEHLGIDDRLGSLEQGKSANLIICSGDVFEKGTEIFETWVTGKKFEINKRPPVDLRGFHEVVAGDLTFQIQLSGKQSAPDAKFIIGSDSLKGKFSQDGYVVDFSFRPKKGKKTYQFSGMAKEVSMEGVMVNADGQRKNWKSKRTKEVEAQKSKPKDKELDLASISPVTYPNLAYGFKEKPKHENVLIKNVTVWTNTDMGRLDNADVQIRDGKVVLVDRDMVPSSGMDVIDGTGKHLTPGIIDEHSHIAISKGVNEGSHSVTAEVRIGDVINSDDVNLYRQLAGGVTTSQLLHGSANPIGGQAATIKLRWGELPEDMKFEDADGFIKFALGENVKQSNWGDQFNKRYPQTRLGVEQIMKDAFQAALEYRKAHGDFAKSGKGLAPRRDIQMETLLEILDKKRFVTCHSYVQSEINMLMKLAESFDFRINTFTHILEGYKIADKLAKHGASGSTFSDWWAYKYEVIDAIPYNAALMTEQGVNSCINSDDAEMGRRLNQEAAKAVKYGGLSEEEALKLVTLNPAKALHLDHRVGSVKKGMDADLVLWSDHPLSIYAKAEKTFVDGKLYYDIEQDQKLREEIRKERTKIIQKMLADEGSKKKPGEDGKEDKLYHCETLESDYNYE